MTEKYRFLQEKYTSKRPACQFRRRAPDSYTSAWYSMVMSGIVTMQKSTVAMLITPV